MTMSWKNCLGENKPMKYIASCSFGKDSMAQIILAYLHKEPLDLVVYCEVMFDHANHISGEIPEHRDFIYKVAIPKIENEFGFKVQVVKSDKDFVQLFHTPVGRGKNKGKLRGFPIGWKCHINSYCKVDPIHKFCKTLKDDFTTYVGIAIDEPKRLEKLRKKKNQISLLEKYGYTEQMAFELCEQFGLLSPIYKHGKRNGCWFCPNQRKVELMHLYRNNKDLFLKLVELDKTENKASEHWNRDSSISEIYEKFKKDDGE